MVTILDFAKLSLYVYKDIISYKLLADYVYKSAIHADSFYANKLRNGMYEVIVSPSTQSTASLGSSFYASCFVKVKNRQATGVVLAIRGTVPHIMKDDATDIKSWWRSVFNNQAQVTPPQHFIARALMFYRQVQKFAQKQLGLTNNKIYLTGHSLGGAIAAILPTYALIQSKAVTFNAPGIIDMPGVRPLWHSVINFRASCDFVSALDAPVGPVWSTEIPECYQQAVKAFEIAREHEDNGWSRLDIINDIVESADFMESFSAQHSMSNLLQALQTNSGKDAVLVSSYGSLEAFLSQADQHPEKVELKSPFVGKT